MWAKGRCSGRAGAVLLSALSNTDVGEASGNDAQLTRVSACENPAWPGT
jgi:hypothetical protein